MCSLDVRKMIELLGNEMYFRKATTWKDMAVARVYVGREFDLVFRSGFFHPSLKMPLPSPHPFAMLMRKMFRNRKVGISQVGFDRIVEMKHAEYSAIFEVGRDFNVILLENGIIQSALRYMEVRHRKIKKGEEYVPPPARDWKEIWEENRKLEAFLTFSGFSGPYAKYISSKFGNVETGNLDYSKVRKEMEHLLSLEPKFLADDETYYLVDIGKGKEVDLFTYFRIEPKHGEKEIQVDSKIREMEEALASIRARISELERMAESGEDVWEELGNLHEKRKKIERKIERAKEMRGKIGAGRKSKKVRGQTKERAKWYHRFRFFEFPGRVFVLGKDAQTNEELVKKYSHLSPAIAHASMSPSPFGIIVPEEGHQVGDEDLRALCHLVACHSVAWKMGIGRAEAYWVSREQVSKKAPSGEFLKKGGFMIYGKKNLVDVELRLCFENRNGKLLVGPPWLVKGICITPGQIPAKDLAVLIRNRIGKEIPAEEIERRIPYGMGNLEGLDI